MLTCNSMKPLAGPTGFEPATSCVTDSIRITILLARLALFCVMVLGYGPNSAAFGPKLDPSFCLRSGRQLYALGADQTEPRKQGRAQKH
jgi:hypothetical protein